MKIDHIGIAVRDIEKSNALFESLLGTPKYKEEYVVDEAVTTSFFEAGEPKIELVVSDKEDSAIGKFLAKRGEGIHHIAFEVEDIEAKMKEMAEKGFRLLHDKPKKGADNKWICFLHPKDTNGVLVELCQSIK